MPLKTKPRAKPTVSPMALLKSHPWFIQELGDLLPADEGGFIEGVELSVIHRANAHGQDSFGWGDTTKIMLTEGRDIKDEATLTFYRGLAQVLCDHLNASKALTKEAGRLSHMDLTP